MAVQPGRLGIAVFSPRLDPQGNSVRAVAACRELAADLGLHLFTVAREPASVVRLATTRRAVASKRRRSPAAAEHLQSFGTRLRLYHLQGALAFASVESVIRELIARATTADYFVLNLKVVQNVDSAAARLLAGACARFSEVGKTLVFADAAAWWQSLIDAGVPREAFFADDDFALEHGESVLLAKRYPDETVVKLAASADCALFAGLSADELARLDRLLVRRRYHGGQTIVAAGQRSEELFVLTRGTAMVSIPTHEAHTRLDVFTPGMTFGEIAFLDRSRRSADVTAVGEVECLVLAREDFARLDASAPAVKIRLLENMALGLTHLLRHSNRELAALS